MSKKTTPKKSVSTVVSVEIVQNKIYVIRGKKVMFDKDLAELYGVLTKNLNKAVSRNKERFPEDFMSINTSRDGKFKVPIWNLETRSQY
jgi:hypothetical protein